MKTYFYILFALIILISAGCEDDGLYGTHRITGEGVIKSETIEVDDFSAIQLEHVANVFVETGKQKKVEIVAYENIIPYMDAVVIGDQLIIRFKQNITVNTDEEIRVIVTNPELDVIQLRGVGNFYLSGPVQNKIKLELDGVGNIEAFDLPVNEALVDINGTGNVEVDAKERLEVDIDGLGNVFYKGSPHILVDINGLGEVIRK